MELRHLSLNDLLTTLSKEPFPYKQEGEWRVGYDDAETKLFMGSTQDGVVTTVIDKASQKHIDNVKKQISNA